MKLIAFVKSLSFSFILFIYVYGLKADYSNIYTGYLFFFPTILLLVSIYTFYLFFKEEYLD